MIVTTPQEFLDAYGSGRAYPPERPAVLRAALVVTPEGFRVSAESAADNPYMARGAEVDPERAWAQHQGLTRKLLELGVPVLALPGRVGLDDAVFPNNAYAAVPGRFIVGSMRHPGRRREAERPDVRALFTETFRYELHDLSRRPLTAELTGPLVIDRPRGIGFCGMTGRVDAAGCEAMHEAFDLRLTFRFDLLPREYHTNLVLSVLAGRASVLHPASFADPEVPAAIARAYPGRTVRLSDEEKAHFAANCLAVTGRDVLMSATAYRVLRPEVLRDLESWGFRCHAVAVDELEKGGGSLRCLIAEVF